MFGYQSLEACSFLEGDMKGVDPKGRGGGEELVEVEGMENIIRAYCMRGEPIFMTWKIRKVNFLWALAVSAVDIKPMLRKQKSVN